MANTFNVVGIFNTGAQEYKDNPYHNLMIQVEFKNDNPKKDCIGTQVDAIKVKYSRLAEIFHLDEEQAQIELLKASYFQFLVGKKIRVYYDRYGSVDGITVIEDKPNQTAPHATK